MKGLFNDDTSSIIVRDALRMNDKGTDAANKGEVGEGQKFLESAESNLLNRIKQRRKVEPDISAALMIVWNSLSLIHKKQNDYLSCFKRLMRIQRVESLITISPLEAATTKLNLALCCHSLGRPSDSLTHSAGALEILSVQLMDAKDESSENEAHRRKLILNYILTLFNRGVHYLALGDTDKFKLNLTQSLELATQKFGKEQPITKMIAAHASKKDTSDLKPFFITKNYDFNTLHYHSRLSEGKYTKEDFGVDDLNVQLVKKNPLEGSFKAVNDLGKSQTRPSSSSKPTSVKEYQASIKSIEKSNGEASNLPKISGSSRPQSKESSRYQNPGKKLDSILFSGNTTIHTFYGDGKFKTRYEDPILISNGKEVVDETMSTKTEHSFREIDVASVKKRREVNVEIRKHVKINHKQQSTEELEEGLKIKKPNLVSVGTSAVDIEPESKEPPDGYFKGGSWNQQEPRKINISGISLALFHMK